METKTIGLKIDAIQYYSTQTKFTHLVINFSTCTHWWNRLWAVVQVPKFLIQYIIKGKATIY